MIALARYILRGPGQAALVITVSALLAIILLPFSWISAGALTLVVLHLGQQAAFRAIAIAGVATVILGWLALGTPTVAILNVIFLWLPAALIAYVLRQTVSLALTMQLLTGIGLLAVTVIYLGFPGLGQTFGEAFRQLLEQAIQQSGSGIEPNQLEQIISWFSRAVPGLLAVVMVMNIVMGLLIGRWWQAALFNPGGLAREFNELRLGKVFAAVAAFLLIASLLVENDWVLGALLVVISMLLIQGIAIMHGLIAIKQLSRSWLVGFYVLLILIPQVTFIVAVVGLLDGLVDIRKQLGTSNSGQ